MHNTTVLTPLYAWAERDGAATALTCGDEHVTRHALVSMVESSALRLAGLGVGRGDRVAVLGPMSIDWATAALGVLRAGAILCPLNERYTAHELAGVLGEIEPTALLRTAGHSTTVDDAIANAGSCSGSGFGPQVASLEGWADGGSTGSLHTGLEPLATLRADDPIVVLPTSGSTGSPKAVVYTHECALGAFFEWALQAPELLGGRALNVSPMSFAAGLLNGFLAPLVLGGSVVLLPQWDPTTALDLIERQQVTSFAATTIFYEQLARQPGFADADLSSLKVAFVGGNPVTVELLDIWTSKSVGLRHAYGLTESLSMVTFPTVQLAATKPASVGFGGVLTKVAVVDGDGDEQPPDTPGEIWISGPGVAAGYWRSPELTTEVFGGGWLRTGDIGVRDDDGALRIVGRAKDIIKSGGMTIYAAEVERAVLELPEIAEAAVISVPDPEFGETPALVARSAAPIDTETILRHARDRLAAYKLPRYVVFVDDPLPRTASMKIDKAAVRRDFADIPDRYRRIGRTPEETSR